MRYRLGMSENEYADRFNNFKARIIDKVQLELAKTDLAFTYQVLRTGKKATGIVFRYSARPIPLDPTPSATKTVSDADLLPAELVEQLRAIGISQDSVAELTRDVCETKRYPVDYIWYVLNKSRQNTKTKIKSLGGWVFKLVRNRSLLDEYERSLKPPTTATGQPRPAAPAGKAAPTQAEVAAREGWRQCLARLEKVLGSQSLATWFKPLQPLVFQNGVLELGVPDQRIYDHIESTYVEELKEVLRQVFGPGFKLEYSVTLAQSA
ncbi:RepB family plasmid replication initiator protein (plasmid) [Hymenobacter sp. BRD128]|nr:RepB family plasmid replication initiator protein [Hymenobacter sp. BRD128]